MLQLFLSLVPVPVVPQEPVLVPLPHERPPELAWPIEVLGLRSEVLDEELRLYVATPPSYGRAERSYPVLLVLDGQYYAAEVASVVAALVATGQIPELVLVGIESRDRRLDFTPSSIRLPDLGDGGRADRYLDFLERELLPALEAERRCGRPRVLLGHSHAGMLVLHALAARPETFSWGVDLDTPVHLEDDALAKGLTATLARAERPPVRLATLEARLGWSDASWDALVAASRPGDLLRRAELPAESHESMVFAASYRALQALFADASALAMRERSAVEVEAAYRALAEPYGAELPPPEPLLRRLVEDLLMEGFGARAGTWLATYEATYGRARDHDALARQVAEVTALGEPEETVAELLALPRATPEELAGYLGTWRGTARTGEAPADPIELELWVDGGEVRGELRFERGPAMRIEYLRLDEDGRLGFGFRNGMRPRGLLVYEDAEPGGPLEGRMGFRGIRFVPPHGQGPPVTRFSLTREP